MIDFSGRDSLAPGMNVPFGSRMFVFIGSTVLMAVVAALVASVVTGSSLEQTKALRIATVVQDLFVFILPPVITAVISSRTPARFLMLDRPCGLAPYLLVAVAMVVMIPAMNLLVAANEAMRLPEFMAGAEEWMRNAEEAAAGSVRILMGTGTVGDLVMNLLVIGILAGFSEEIFFRGGLQQLLMTRPLNPHVAIWVTAVIFSAIHLQFYGFFPRLLLGAYFGYLAWWSGTIWLPVVAHVLNNSAVVVSGWLELRGALTFNLDEIGLTGSEDARMLLPFASAVLLTLVIVLIERVCWRKCRA